MTAYRGISKYNIIKSLNEAKATLAWHNLGPASAQVLENWQSQQPIEKLAAAHTKAAFCAAMEKETRTAQSLANFQAVFEREALIEIAAGNTHGRAVMLYRTLTAWGAFQNHGMSSSDAKVEKEIGAFLKDTDTGQDFTRLRQILNISPPLRRYGILIGENEGLPSLKKELEDATEILRDTGDVNGITLGAVRHDINRIGYSFNATASGARKVADALPNRTVYIYEGVQVSVTP